MLQKTESLRQTPAPFKAAQRHSTRVKWLRRILPIIGVLGIIGFLGKSFLIQAEGPNVGLAGITVNSTGITMEKPYLTGHDKGGRKYEVSAFSARQELGKSKQLWLDDIVASLELPNNGWAKITATTGLYDGEKETLDLQKNIHVVTHLGYTIELKHAYIELHNGVIRSNEPVDVSTENKDTIRSDRLSITQGGESIIFDGRVKVQLQSSNAQAGLTQ